MKPLEEGYHARIQPISGAQGIDLRLELADDLPAVFGDRLQATVVQNIVRNASDAMTDIGDRPRRMLIRTAARPDNTVTFSVTDSGIGLPSTGQESPFDAFYTTKTDGMGIGLFVSRTITERHNGSLWAEPEPILPERHSRLRFPALGDAASPPGDIVRDRARVEDKNGAGRLSPRSFSSQGLDLRSLRSHRGLRPPDELVQRSLRRRQRLASISSIGLLPPIEKTVKKSLPPI